MTASDTEGGDLVRNSALLVMDVQRPIVERIADQDGYLWRLVRAIATARGHGVPVLYVKVAFREGFPEISRHNQAFSAIAKTGRMVETDPHADIHPEVAPLPGDVVVTKRRVSAFTGSDLEVVLRGLGVETLVLTGIATSGVVLSTLRQAADLDYRLLVLEDACVDADAEVHRVLTTKVFPRQATVMTVDQWADDDHDRDGPGR